MADQGGPDGAPTAPHLACATSRGIGRPAREPAPAVVLVMPDAGDRPLIRTSLVLAHGLGARLRAWAFREPGDCLPPALRAAQGGPTEADRAIDRLVQGASAGERVTPERLPDEPEGARSAAARLRSLGDDALLVLGRVRGGPRPDVQGARLLAEAHRGPILVLFDRRNSFSSVLAVTPPDGSPFRDAFARVAYALERSYPVSWWHGATAASDLDLAFRDATWRQLVLACVPCPGDPGPVALLVGDRELPTSSPVAVLLPAEPGRGSLVARLLGAEPCWRPEPARRGDADGGTARDAGVPAAGLDDDEEDEEGGEDDLGDGSEREQDLDDDGEEEADEDDDEAVGPDEDDTLDDTDDGDEDGFGP